MKVSLCFCTILLFTVHLTSGQRKIELEHTYTSKQDKTYNMDGAEIYLISNMDTIFIQKTGKYDFATSVEIDSLIDTTSSTYVPFLVKTHTRAYLIQVDKSLYARSSGVRFHFCRGKSYDYGAVTYNTLKGCGPSSNAQAVMLPNKEWKRKFYPYTGQKY